MLTGSSTLRLFAHDRVAEGYASVRPFLQPRVFALVRDLIGPASASRRALDVGCGTGMSSIALRGLADEVVAVDASTEMLRRARRAQGVRYFASCAESLPFVDGSFDLVVACGSIDWVDRSRFLPSAAALLQTGGWLIALDFGDTARSPRIPGLQQWYREVFLRRCPRPPSADPIIGRDEALSHGFTPPRKRDFVFPWPFSADKYAEFLLTESSVIAAVEHGRHSAAEIRQWLISELRPLFGAAECEIDFAGYIQSLQRKSERICAGVAATRGSKLGPAT